MLLHEVLVALSGIPGDIFRFIKPPEPFSPSECHFICKMSLESSHKLHPSEILLLERITQLGAIVYSLRTFLDKLPNSLYISVFKEYIETLLNNYELKIVHLEKQCLTQSANKRPGSLTELETLLLPVNFTFF
jgi:hypothetical protein